MMPDRDWRQVKWYAIGSAAAVVVIAILYWVRG